jgi:hypothetical protein
MLFRTPASFVIQEELMKLCCHVSAKASVSAFCAVHLKTCIPKMPQLSMTMTSCDEFRLTMGVASKNGRIPSKHEAMREGGI